MSGGDLMPMHYSNTSPIHFSQMNPEEEYFHKLNCSNEKFRRKKNLLFNNKILTAIVAIFKSL